jgi:urea carboxylase
VGNAEGAPALELTLSGPTLQFNFDTVICLTGADMTARIGDRAVPFWQPVGVAAGDVLKLGSVTGAGARAYLAVRGGFDVPEYLGSRATFTLGKFGGHGGRAVLPGDVLHVAVADTGQASAAEPLTESLRPQLTRAWEIGVLYGPHGAPDFFTKGDIAAFFDADWEVHYNSNRTGVRLIGPKPEWARADGGEAGLHPSNIHDNAYAIGAVDFTGDMPVILGPDGPSLGGFVCPVTIVRAELWKLGQLRPGDTVRFIRLSPVEARALEIRQDQDVASLAVAATPVLIDANSLGVDDCIVGVRPQRDALPRVVYRRQGDKYLLVEYGPIVLDLELRFRVHVLMTRLEMLDLAGIIDLTPGIRSLQVHYDSRVLSLASLIETLSALEHDMGDIGDIEVPSRIVHMPLSWDDAATQLAISKYMQSVRADAPWCPSNIEFIRRINGLDSVEDVKRIAYEASYLVLGLGDVYLGAPVATPVDPRHRLVTTKYNPARTWTPENAVGIGGAYLCIYGMEGPGGYQFIGRTAQVWNTHRITPEFDADKPWLLRFFDQIRFHPMSAEELLAFRDGFLQGKVGLEIEPATFKLSDYRRFLADNAEEIAAFKTSQQAAFEAERSRWQSSDQTGATVSEAVEDDGGDEALAANAVAVGSPVPGAVWKVEVSSGARVKEGDLLVVVESMKMEMSVHAPSDGVVAEVRCAEGRAVSLGQTLVVLVSDTPEAAQ